VSWDGQRGLDLSRCVRLLLNERAANELLKRVAVRGWGGQLNEDVVGNGNVQRQQICASRTISSMSSCRVRDENRRCTWTLCQVFLEDELSWRVTGSLPVVTLVARAAQTVFVRRETHPLSLGDADIGEGSSEFEPLVDPPVSALRRRCGGTCLAVDARVDGVCL
jgi:hypothetical protein